MLKRIISILCILSLLAVTLPAMAANNWTCSNCGYRFNGPSAIYCGACGAAKNSGSSTSGYNSNTAFAGVKATSCDRIATRTGPGTHFDGAGSFGSAGTEVMVYSIWYDSNKVCWVEIGIANRRIYTGMKRMSNSKYLFNNVPMGVNLGITARLTSFTNIYYGPGYHYDMQKLSLASGKYVSIVTMENGWAQVEWSDHRGWVPLSVLNY